MSWRALDSSNARAINTTGLSGNVWTLAGWYRRNAASATAEIVSAYSGGTNWRAEMQATAAGGDVRRMEGSGFNGTDSVFTVADNEWVYVAVGSTGTTLWGYAWRDTVSEDRTDLGQSTPGGSTGNPSGYFAGGNSGLSPYLSGALGEYVHMRYWNASLSTTELNAERKSATAVRTSGLVGDHPLASKTDTSDASGNGYTLTFAGTVDTHYDTGASYPTSIGGGSSAVDLAGAATGGATASADASVTKPIEGAATAGATAAGTLLGDVPLAGDATGGAAASGALTVESRRFEFTLYAVDGSTPLANKTGLWWAWWDVLADVRSTAPDASGTGASTDASGVFSVVAPSALSAGVNQGFGIISDQDATPDATEAAYVGSFDVV